MALDLEVQSPKFFLIATSLEADELSLEGGR